MSIVILLYITILSLILGLISWKINFEDLKKIQFFISLFVVCSFSVVFSVMHMNFSNGVLFGILVLDAVYAFIYFVQYLKNQDNLSVLKYIVHQSMAVVGFSFIFLLAVMVLQL